MKNLITLLFALLIISISPVFGGDNDMKPASSCGTAASNPCSTIFLNTALSNSKACGTNYSRVPSSPNECRETTDIFTGITIGTTCTQLTLLATWGVPAGTIEATIPISGALTGGGTAGQDTSRVNLFSDVACAVPLDGDLLTATAQVTAVGTVASSGLIEARAIFAATMSTNGSIFVYAKKTDTLTAGATSTWSAFQPSRYWD